MILRLAYRPPLDWEAMLSFLDARCTAGVEQVEGSAYRRTVRVDGARGWVTVTAETGRPVLRAEFSPSLIWLYPSTGRLRSRGRLRCFLARMAKAMDEAAL